MKKLLYIVGALVAVVLLLVIFVLTRDFDSDELGNALLAKVGEATGIELTATSFRLNLSQGLWLEGVEAHGEMPGGEFSARLDKLVFEHRLLPLLRGEVVIDRVVLEGPQIEVVSYEVEEAVPAEDEPAAAGEATETEEPAAAEEPAPTQDPAAAADAEEAGLSLVISEISIRNGTLTARNEGSGESLSISGLEILLRDLSLDPTAGDGLEAFSGRGTIGAEAVSMGDTTMALSSGDLVADHGVFTASEFNVTAPAGVVGVETMAVDLTGEAIEYSIAAAASDVNPNVLLGVGDQTALGDANLTLQAQGTGTELDGLTANGALRLSAGALPSIDPLPAVDTILGTSLVGTAYNATEVRFGMAGSVITIEPFTLESEIMKISGGATADLGGPLAGNMAIGIPRGEVSEDAGVARNVLDAITAGDDWLTVPLVITGTLDEPDFGPDTDAITQAVADAGRRAVETAAGAAVDRLEQEVVSGIDSILGGVLGGEGRNRPRRKR